MKDKGIYYSVDIIWITMYKERERETENVCVCV